MHFSNESRKRKTNCSWPLTLIMQKRDHFWLLRHHYSESPVIPLSNDIWYRCVAHGFNTFYFLIFYHWSKTFYHPCITYIKCFLTSPQWTLNILSSMYYLYKVFSDLPSVDIINSTCYVLDIDWALIKNSLNLETGHDQTALLS
jgi:hypothetical protein